MEMRPGWRGLTHTEGLLQPLQSYYTFHYISPMDAQIRRSLEDLLGNQTCCPVGSLKASFLKLVPKNNAAGEALEETKKGR